MDLLKGKIVRKVSLSWLELQGLGIEKEKEEEITFTSDEISNVSSFEYDRAIVGLKKPPFENTEDFHVIVETSELLKSKKIMSNIIDKTLRELETNGSIPIHKDSSKELISVIPKMKAYELVKYENHSLKLTKNGYEVLKIGSFENWLNKQNQPTSTTQEFYTGSTVIKGDGNQLLDQRNSNGSTGTINKPNSNDSEKGAFNKTWIIPIVIGLIIGIILLVIEYGPLQSLMNG